MKVFGRCLLLLPLLLAAARASVLAQQASGSAISATSPLAPRSIPLEQLGAEAQKQYGGGDISITPIPGGAKLRAMMQDLEAEANSEGLWLISTADEDKGRPNRFRVRAMEVGRGKSPAVDQAGTVLTPTGTVRCTKDAAVFTRAGVVEEYTVSTDGVRQDFVILQRPAGRFSDKVNLSLDITGARAEAASYGAKLTIAATGRELAYSRLKVTDAAGKELAARMMVPGSHCISVEVDDAAAVYPVRIDPTFSDADWVSMGAGPPGVNGPVNAVTVDAAGYLYIGGFFTSVAGIAATNIARWNGSAWSAMGAGVDGGVYALSFIEDVVVVGGRFTTADGVNVNNLAGWDSGTWFPIGNGIDGFVFQFAYYGGVIYAISQLDSGSGNRDLVGWGGGANWEPLGLVDGSVTTMAVSGANFYIGGFFSDVDGVSADNIAMWNGSFWSPLGSGLEPFSGVSCLAVTGSTVYAGGSFQSAGGNPASFVARWNGSTWSPLGGGLNAPPNAMTMFGGTLFVGGAALTQAGSVSVSGIAQWNGTSWSAMGGGLSPSQFGTVEVNCMAAAGGALYVGGGFISAGGIVVNNFARWTGTWSNVGPTPGLGSFAYGSGPFDLVSSFAISGSHTLCGWNLCHSGRPGILRCREVEWHQLVTYGHTDGRCHLGHRRERYLRLRGRSVFHGRCHQRE
jgi:hypothetical protein